MRGHRVLKAPTFDTNDWKQTKDPSEATFSMRVWGGSKEVPYGTVTQPQYKSNAIWFHFVTDKPEVIELFKQFNTSRMQWFTSGSVGNEGGIQMQPIWIKEEYHWTKYEHQRP